mgnify:CR=1 FL=1
MENRTSGRDTFEVKITQKIKKAPVEVNPDEEVDPDAEVVV